MPTTRDAESDEHNTVAASARLPISDALICTYSSFGDDWFALKARRPLAFGTPSFLIT
jgi:hypothetical protein